MQYIIKDSYINKCYTKLGNDSVFNKQDNCLYKCVITIIVNHWVRTVILGSCPGTSGIIYFLTTFHVYI